ncbi:glutamate--tRNA ligase [Zavarzinia sp. CC-PAN008]|uniref:glutamate--tRNA ligase n=1 Tax=Zavarzinia sp. CC-PAN008 TaxID=3243332 RepID=UPI003F7486BD
MSRPAPIVRFAPSPTGYLHIGGARTALFNWLYARHHGGTFLLRIEDTDRARSTEDAIAKIFDGLAWLGIDSPEEPVFQFARAARHAEVAHQMMAKGLAYHCYATPEELAEMRETAKKEGRPPRYDGRWRDRDPATAPAGVKPVVRLKAPQTGETVVDDLVQGVVRVGNQELDDMVLLRSDGTPTYMLSVVVDDHDMGITHVIRGDDHLTNTFRQVQIYRAMDWDVPRFGHIPLIHGPDGAKLSKRHGALGVEAYRDDLGFLPEAVRNYLLRLGWSHGDEEIISTEQAIAWFDMDAVGRSPSRFDMAKLTHLNAHYMKAADDARLAALVAERLTPRPDAAGLALLTRAMPGLKERSRTLVDLADAASFYVQARPLALDAKAAALLADGGAAVLRAMAERIADLPDWTAAGLEAAARAHAEEAGLKLGAVAQPLRAALAGRLTSPPVFEVAENLGRDQALGRIADALAGR